MDAASDVSSALQCKPGWLQVLSQQGPLCAPDVPAWGALPAMATPVQAAADGVYSDPRTQRQWLLKTATVLYNWQQAQAACAAEQSAGQSDWHLPTAAELQTLCNFKYMLPASDLPLAPTAWYWSASPVASAPDKAWGVAMASGMATQVPATTTGLALCVRAVAEQVPAKTARFESDAKHETVLDHLTGLTWQRQGDASGLQPFAYAQSYCEKLPLAGGGWRTPSLQELAGLVDRSTAQPAADAVALPGTKAAPYWTNTAYKGAAIYAWYVEFFAGSSSFDGDQTYTYAWVRCVR